MEALDFRVIMHDMQALNKKEIFPSRMRKYCSGEILFCGDGVTILRILSQLLEIYG